MTQPLRAPAAADAVQATAAPAAPATPPAAPATPLAGAWAFVEALRALTPAEWDALARRARAVDSLAQGAAARRLGEALVGHPQSRALDACARAAVAAARRAGEGALPPGLSAEYVVGYAEHVASRAVLAVALAHDLGADDLARLTAPFAPVAPARWFVVPRGAGSTR